MQTRVSTKGQIVIPGPLRRRLGIQAGDPLDIEVQGRRIVLSTRSRPTCAPQIVVDPITGLPALSAGPDAPVLSSREVEEILSKFP